MPTQDSLSVPDDRNIANDDVSLVEILLVCARHKRLVLIFPLLSSLVAAAICLALPNLYTGIARVLPPHAAASPLSSVLLGDLAGSNVGASVSQALGLKNPSDLYVEMLRSHSIADALIKRFDLQILYGTETLVQTRKYLSDVTSITAGQGGIITIAVDDRDPKRAADLANAYAEELDRLTQTVAVTTAGRRRIFFEKQFRQVKEDLANAEVALRRTQERTGLISVSEQGRAMIASVANLQALIAAKQVQLAGMRAATTESNPDYVRGQQELAGLRIELQKLEKSSSAESGSVIPSAGKIPEAGLEYIRKYRDMQYYQALYELIGRQYEIAKAQEAAETGPLQVLDRATPPDRKSKPHRSLIVLVTGIITGFVGIAAAFVLEGHRRAMEDPAKRDMLTELKNHFAWRRK